MKKHVTYLLILIFSTGPLVAQELKESYLLVTDRGHYICGEELYYRVHVLNSDSDPVSSSFYVELIDPRGQALINSKISADPEGGSGLIRIPDGLASGTYYLRAYSRWMRNCGPETYSYTSMQVYNPYTNTVLAADPSGNLISREYDFSEEGNVYEQFTATLSGEFASTRESMELRLENKERYDHLDLSVSIVQKNLLSGQRVYPSTCRLDVSEEARFIPETSGVSISGRAISASDGSPASYATVYLSVLGRQREFFCNYADSSGRFFFSFPDRYGSYELFLSTHHADYEELELLIDSDFSNEEIQLPSYPLKLDSTLAARINEMSVNSQVNRQFYPSGEPSAIQDTVRDETLFYGHPTVTIQFGDFIKLPTLSEYFYEVIPQVSLRRNRNRTTFQVNGLHPDLRLYQPLVMIDGVAIFDMEALLEVSPRLIDRVEIITAPYLRSDVTFGGIISLITKENDMGYIDLPSSGLLLKYQMLEQKMPEDPILKVTKSNLPDTRNTLLWEPHITLEPGKDLSLDFTTADTRGDYEVTIRGWTSEGRSFEKRIPFVVR